MTEEKQKGNVIELKKEGNLWIWEHEGKEYGIRKWTWGEKNRVMSISTTLRGDGEERFDVAKFNINMLLATLKKAPFAINKESLEQQDPLLIDQIFNISSKLNLLSPAKIQNL